MFFIELTAGLGYFIGNYFLSRDKVIGWNLKIIGGIAWIVFLYLNKNYIFMAVMVMIVLTMLYGLYKWKHKLFNTRTIVDKAFEILTVLVAISMVTVYIVQKNYSFPVGFETLIVIAEITATMLLARKLIAGWYTFIVYGVLVGVLVIFVNPQPAILLGLLELASIYFYIQGIKLMKKKL